MDELVKYAEDHWPKAALILLVILATISATVYVCKKYFHWTGKIIKSEDDCKKIDSINTSLGLINSNVTSLIMYLKTKDGGMDTSLFKSFSPIQLTEIGQEILTAIGGEKFVNENLTSLFHALEAQNIKTALDVQNAAPLVIGLFSTLDSFNDIKNYLFKNPNYKYIKDDKEILIPIDLNTATTVLGIYLRNKFLEARPNIIPDWDNTKSA